MPSLGRRWMHTANSSARIWKLKKFRQDWVRRVLHAPFTLAFSGDSVVGPALFILYTRPRFDLVRKHTVTQSPCIPQITITSLRRHAQWNSADHRNFSNPHYTCRLGWPQTAIKPQNLSKRMSIHSSLTSLTHIRDADVPLEICGLWKRWRHPWLRSQYVITFKQNIQKRIRHITEFHTAHSHHFSNSNFVLFSCYLSLRLRTVTL